MNNKVKIVSLMVLMNNRNRDKIFRSLSSNVICVRIKCRVDQYREGLAHNKALEIAMKFIHTELKTSCENFDLLCFSKSEGHFIRPEAWKLSNWKKSNVVDISDKQVKNSD